MSVCPSEVALVSAAGGSLESALGSLVAYCIPYRTPRRTSSSSWVCVPTVFLLLLSWSHHRHRIHSGTSFDHASAMCAFINQNDRSIDWLDKAWTQHTPHALASYRRRFPARSYKKVHTGPRQPTHKYTHRGQGKRARGGATAPQTTSSTHRSLSGAARGR